MRTTFQKAAAVALLAAATLIAQEPSVPDTLKLQKMAARFAPTEITADVSKLSPADRRVPAKPEGANFYPVGAPKAEIERWIQSLSDADRARATGFFTVIRRAGNNGFS